MSVYLREDVHDALLRVAGERGVTPARLAALWIAERVDRPVFESEPVVNHVQAGSEEYRRLVAIAQCVDNGRHRRFYPCPRCPWGG